MLRELQDQTYHELWTEKASFEVTLLDSVHSKTSTPDAVGRHSFHVFHIIYVKADTSHGLSRRPQDCESRASNLKLPWILTDGQIFQEAMEQFDIETTWTYARKVAYYQAEPPDLQIMGWKLPLSGRQSRPRKVRQLLALQNAYCIEVSTHLELMIHGEVDDRESQACRVRFEDAKATPLLQLLATGIARSANLKRLSLHLLPHRWYEIQAEDPIRVDLQLLDALCVPSLQSFALTVHIYGSFQTNTQVKAVLRGSVSHTGKALIGIEGKEIFVKFQDTELRWDIMFTNR
jgi:hypothetical protein